MTALATGPIAPDTSLNPLLQQILNAPPPQQGRVDGTLQMLTAIMSDNVTAEEVMGIAAQLNVRNTQAQARNAVLGQQALQGKLDASIATRDARNRDIIARQQIEANRISALFQGRQQAAELERAEAQAEALPEKLSTEQSQRETILETSQLELEAATVRFDALPDIIKAGQTKASADARTAVANATIAEAQAGNIDKKIAAAEKAEAAVIRANTLTGDAAQARIRVSDARVEGLRLDNEAKRRELEAVSPFNDPILTIYKEADKFKDEKTREEAKARMVDVFKNQDMPNSLKTASAGLVAHYIDISHDKRYGEIDIDGNIISLNAAGQKVYRKRVVNFLSNPEQFDSTIGQLEADGHDPFSGYASMLVSIENEDIQDVINVDLFQEIIKEYKRLGGKRGVSNTGIAPQPIEQKWYETVIKMAGYRGAVAANLGTLGPVQAFGAEQAFGIPGPLGDIFGAGRVIDAAEPGIKSFAKQRGKDISKGRGFR